MTEEITVCYRKKDGSIGAYFVESSDIKEAIETVKTEEGVSRAFALFQGGKGATNE